MPQTMWLKTHKCIIVPEDRCLKWVSWATIKVSVGLCSFLEALGENLLSCLLQLLEAACIPCLVAPSICKVSKSRLNLLTPSASLFPIERTLMITLGPHG